MITIFTKDYCPYCVSAKEFIKSIGLAYTEVDITENPQKIRELVTISWMMTVPQIFSWEINKENCLWGYDDVRKLYSDGKFPQPKNAE